MTKDQQIGVLRDALHLMLCQFTSTPSTLADTEARRKGHDALALTAEPSSAAPVSGQAASIADDPEFVRLRNNYVTSLDPRPVVTQREQDWCKAAWREFVAYIDSRPRSEDSRTTTCIFCEHLAAAQPQPFGYIGKAEVEKLADKHLAGLGMMISKDPAEHRMAIYLAPPPPDAPAIQTPIGIVATYNRGGTGERNGIEPIGKPHCSLAEALPAGTLIYAAPAIQTQPLTDVDIELLWQAHTKPVFGRVGINPNVFARAIERHLAGATPARGEGA